jgi:4-amino-4-deoxychorismate lyase
MYQLIETIKIFNGKIYNINLHNKRLNNTRRDLFNANNFIKIEDHIKIREENKKIILKCRVIYNEEILQIEIEPYLKRNITKLKIIHANEINYKYKFEDRSKINNLCLNIKSSEDILIIKNNLITDTSFSNIVLTDGKSFFTPKSPLLKGTKREELISNKTIKERDIKQTEIKQFKKAYLINAMLDLFEAPIEIKNIIYS